MEQLVNFPGKGVQDLPFVGAINTPKVVDIQLRPGNALVALLFAPKRTSILYPNSKGMETWPVESYRYQIIKVEPDPQLPWTSGIEPGNTIHVMEGAWNQLVRVDTSDLDPELYQGSEIDDLLMVNLGEVAAWDNHKVLPSEVAPADITREIKRKERENHMRMMGLGR